MCDARVSVGVRAGFWSAAALIIWYTLVDVVQGQPLASPAYMSGLIFSFTTALPATARLLAFIAVLCVAYALIGVITAAVFRKLGAKPRWIWGVLLGLMLFGLWYVLADMIYGVNLPMALGYRTSLAGDVVSGVVLMLYLQLKLRN